MFAFLVAGTTWFINRLLFIVGRKSFATLVMTLVSHSDSAYLKQTNQNKQIGREVRLKHQSFTEAVKVGIIKSGFRE